MCDEILALVSPSMKPFFGPNEFTDIRYGLSTKLHVHKFLHNFFGINLDKFSKIKAIYSFDIETLGISELTTIKDLEYGQSTMETNGREMFLTVPLPTEMKNFVEMHHHIRYLPLPLILNRNIDYKSSASVHQCLCILDTIAQKIYYFDPNLNYDYLANSRTKAGHLYTEFFLSKYFELCLGYTFVFQKNWIPQTLFQKDGILNGHLHTESFDRGTCISWCMFLYHWLFYSGVEHNQNISEILELLNFFTGKQLKDIIYNYIGNLVEYLLTTGIISEKSYLNEIKTRSLQNELKNLLDVPLKSLLMCRE